MVTHNINVAHEDEGDECTHEELKTGRVEAQNRCTLPLCPSTLNHTSRENDPYLVMWDWLPLVAPFSSFFFVMLAPTFNRLALEKGSD
jgi:hypothetical protein